MGFRFDYRDVDSANGGVRLSADFLNDKLTEVDSYVRTLWREVTGRYDGGRPTLFRLSKDGAHEGTEFTQIYCPQ